MLGGGCLLSGEDRELTRVLTSDCGGGQGEGGDGSVAGGGEDGATGGGVVAGGGGLGGR